MTYIMLELKHSPVGSINNGVKNGGKSSLLISSKNFLVARRSTDFKLSPDIYIDSAQNLKEITL